MLCFCCCPVPLGTAFNQSEGVAAFRQLVGLQIWGVLLGVAVQTFAKNWTLLGAGTRAWEVGCTGGSHPSWQVVAQLLHGA